MLPAHVPTATPTPTSAATRQANESSGATSSLLPQISFSGTPENSNQSEAGTAIAPAGVCATPSTALNLAKRCCADFILSMRFQPVHGLSNVAYGPKSACYTAMYLLPVPLSVLGALTCPLPYSLGHLHVLGCSDFVPGLLD